MAQSLNERALKASEKVEIWATRDLEGPGGKVAVHKGQRRLVYGVDARELMRGENHGNWTRINPAKAAGTAVERRGFAESNFELSDIPGLSRAVVGGLEDAGYGDLDKLRGASVDELSGVSGIGERLAENILGWVGENFPRAVTNVTKAVAADRPPAPVETVPRAEVLDQVENVVSKDGAKKEKR